MTIHITFAYSSFSGNNVHNQVVKYHSAASVDETQVEILRTSSDMDFPHSRIPVLSLPRPYRNSKRIS